MVDVLSTLEGLFTLYGCLKIQAQIGRKKNLYFNVFPFLA